MKAQLVFATKRVVYLRFGGQITVYMDCYEIGDAKLGFAKAFTFSWIAFDSSDPKRMVLMDQHTGRPCHLHVGEKDIVLSELPETIDAAINLFWFEVKKHFGEILEAP